MQEKIFDPDGLIEAYSRYLDRDLLVQKIYSETTHKQENTRPTESDSSELAKKVAVYT